MEPKTPNLLYDAISADYAWRITELSTFRSLILSQQNERSQKVLLRAGIALLYAHWEGFIKSTADLYYDFVCQQKMRIEELNDSFVGIALRSEIELLLKSKKLKQHTKLIQVLFDEREKQAYFSSTSPIKTSNLKYEVFEDVCILIGIDPNIFIEKYRRLFDRSMQLTIDEDLVKRRNSIAHGEYFPVDIDEFKKLYDIVINGFLYNFKEVVMDAAQLKKYTRNNAKTIF